MAGVTRCLYSHCSPSKLYHFDSAFAHTGRCALLTLKLFVSFSAVCNLRCEKAPAGTTPKIPGQTCNGGPNGAFDNGLSSDLKECLHGSRCMLNGAGYIYCAGCPPGKLPSRSVMVNVLWIARAFSGLSCSAQHAREGPA